MKVKFKYGIKSFSGTHDELVFANYEDYGVVIGRMLPRSGEPTPNQEMMGKRLSILGGLWNSCVSAGYKADLAVYAQKYSLLPERSGSVGVNAFSVFVKAVYAAYNDVSTNFEIEDMTCDDLQIDAYPYLDNVADMVDNGFLPEVFGYELLTASIAA